MKKNYEKQTKILTWACLVVYIFSFLALFTTQYNKERDYEILYKKLMQETVEFNSNLDKTTSITTDKPMFTNAKSAVNYAYNKVMDSKGWELFITGTINMTATKYFVNIPITMQLNSTQAKFLSGNYYAETMRYEEGNKNEQTQSNRRYYTNGKCYSNEADNTTITYNPSTGIINATYDNDKYLYLFDANFATYVVNNSTITKDLYFKTNYNAYTGKIESYSASVQLNPTLATKDYAVLIQKQAYYSSLPVFTSLDIHCTISATGQLLSAILNETYTAKMSSYGGVDLSSQSTYTIYVTTYDSAPTIKEPTNISN